MAKQSQVSADAEIPNPALWQSPLSWAGSPARPVHNFSRSFPAQATFVRAELIFSVAEAVAPGTTREAEHAVPGLLKLSRSKPVEVHATGLDSQCWTYRNVRQGRKSIWTLAVGDSFPAEQSANRPNLGQKVIERVVVQSILPMDGPNKHIALVNSSDSIAEDLEPVVRTLVA